MKSSLKGAILQNGARDVTKLKLFSPIIRKEVSLFNWLLTDIDSDYYSAQYNSNNYEFLSGEEFLELMEKEEFTFIWGVFTAFPKDMSIKKILSENIPFANGYIGFWKNPISLQHPSAIIELVLWDGMLALLISQKNDMVDKFLDYYQSSIDLEEYNKS